MAFLRSDYVFHDSLRSPTRDAHDSQSCAITRGSVPNDTGSSCKRLRAQRDSMGKELSRVEHYAQHFARAADRLRTERDEARAASTAGNCAH